MPRTADLSVRIRPVGHAKRCVDFVGRFPQTKGVSCAGHDAAGVCDGPDVAVASALGPCQGVETTLEARARAVTV